MANKSVGAYQKDNGFWEYRLDDINGTKFYVTDLVNCLPNGRLQTVNSMKCPTREIKQKPGIKFMYHYLRHT